MRTVVSRWFLVAASALEAMDEPSEARDAHHRPVMIALITAVRR
jgi:hypothetical protein